MVVRGFEKSPRLVDVERHDRALRRFGHSHELCYVYGDKLEASSLRERRSQSGMSERDAAPGTVLRLVVCQPSLHVSGRELLEPDRPKRWYEIPINRATITATGAR